MAHMLIASSNDFESLLVNWLTVVLWKQPARLIMIIHIFKCKIVTLVVRVFDGLSRKLTVVLVLLLVTTIVKNLMESLAFLQFWFYYGRLLLIIHYFFIRYYWTWKGCYPLFHLDMMSHNLRVLNTIAGCFDRTVHYIRAAILLNIWIKLLQFRLGVMVVLTLYLIVITCITYVGLGSKRLI